MSKRTSEGNSSHNVEAPPVIGLLIAVVLMLAGLVYMFYRIYKTDGFPRDVWFTAFGVLIVFEIWRYWTTRSRATR